MGGTPSSPNRGVVLHTDLARVPPPPPGLDGGTSSPPQKGYGTNGCKYYWIEMGYPPPPMDRQTPVKTVPSPFLWNTSCNNECWNLSTINYYIQCYQNAVNSQNCDCFRSVCRLPKIPNRKHTTCREFLVQSNWSWS